MAHHFHNDVKQTNMEALKISDALHTPQEVRQPTTGYPAMTKFKTPVKNSKINRDLAEANSPTPSVQPSPGALVGAGIINSNG